MLNRPDAQIVFVDTPGHPQAPHAAGRAAQRHRPPSAIGDVDVVCLVVDATAPIGPGDRFVAERVPADAIVVVNKIDIAAPDEVLAPAGHGGRPARPSASTSRCRPGPARACPTLVAEHRRAGCPRARSTTPTTWSPTCPRRSGWPSWSASSCWPSPATSCRTRSPPGSPSGSGPASACEILVERDSQKGIVIGKKGAVLKAGRHPRCASSSPRAPSSSCS